MSPSLSESGPSSKTFPDIFANADKKPSPERLKALYTFTSRQSDINPSGYKANVDWWKHAIESGLRQGVVGGASNVASTSKESQSHGGGDVDRLFLRCTGHGGREDLEKRLEWPGVGRPKGLGSVLTSCLDASPPSIIATSTFLNSPQPLEKPASLASRFVAQPLWWAASKVNPIPYVFGSSDPVTAVPEDQLWKRISKAANKDGFVWMPLVREAANNFLAHIAVNQPAVNTARLLTPAIFQQTYSEVCFPDSPAKLSLLDCQLLLKYLTRDRSALVTDEKGEVYKIIDSDDERTSVTEADRGTVAVMTALSSVDRQIAQVEKEVVIAKTKAARYLSLKQKPVALTYLRSKRMLEEELVKRVNTAEQLRTILRKIDAAHGDVEVMRAYETSSSTLKSVLAHPLLQRQRVEDTIDSLSEVMADQREIDQAIQLGGQQAVEASGFEMPDEKELEDELSKLMLEDAKAPVAAAPVKPTKEPATPPSDTPTITSKAAPEGKSWEQVHEEAQERRREEAQRAEDARLRKEERMQLAE